MVPSPFCVLVVLPLRLASGRASETIRRTLYFFFLVLVLAPVCFFSVAVAAAVVDAADAAIGAGKNRFHVRGGKVQR